MIEDRLEQTFKNLGYHKIKSNIEGIYLYYQISKVEVTIISVIRTLTGTDMGIEQYEHILAQIKNKFRKEPHPVQIRLLSLILTSEVERVKQLCTRNREDQHWIIDVAANRLIIYETGSNEFKDIRGWIEEVLSEEDQHRPFDQEAVYHDTFATHEYNSRDMGGRGPILNRYHLFTLITTIIIITNIIAFIIQHYIPMFGERGSMLGRGALSWYFVFEKKEYYRVLTSMFMHSDLEHLFNNMLVLFFVGNNLERAAGKIRYLFLYFGTGILAGLASISYNMWKEGGQFLIGNSVFSIGASGAIFGVVGAMLFIVAINRGRIADISTRQMVLFVVFSLYGGVTNTQIDQAAHIGGFLAGIVLAAITYRRPKGEALSG